MNKIGLVRVYRFIFATISLAAISTQLTTQIQHHSNLVHFFSFFTNIANIFTIFVLYSNSRDSIRGAAVTYMSLVGIVFHTLLSNGDLGLLLHWVNGVVHYLMPLVIVIDWIFLPPKTKLKYKIVFTWAIAPLTYLAYAIIHGVITGWYPYPFFNPDKTGGFTGVGIYCAAMFILFFLLGAMVVTVGNRRFALKS